MRKIIIITCLVFVSVFMFTSLLFAQDSGYRGFIREVEPDGSSFVLHTNPAREVTIYNNESTRFYNVSKPKGEESQVEVSELKRADQLFVSCFVKDGKLFATSIFLMHRGNFIDDSWYGFLCEKPYPYKENKFNRNIYDRIKYYYHNY